MENGKNPSNFEGVNNEVKKEDQIESVEVVENDKTTNRHDDETAETDLTDKLPDLLQHVCSCFDSRHREMILMSSLTVISSVLPNVYGIYNHCKVYPNLFLYVIGKAGSGKGNMVWTNKLISGIERGEKSEEATNKLLQKLMANGYGGNQLPRDAEIVIPANSSAAGFTQLFNDRGGKGLVFETEGDTLANIFKADYGNWSDIMRKAFHHEPISQYRKTEGVHVSITEPKLSVLISSTPNQLKRIISSAENGLFSRFGFIFTEPVDEFVDVFAVGKHNRDDIFNQASEELLALYGKLLQSEGCEVVFNDEQKIEFINFFNKSKSLLTNMFHEDLDASVNRAGLIMFRFAQILTVLRNNDSDLEGSFVCSDDDFEIAMELAEQLLYNANEAIRLLPRQGTDEMSDNKRSMFQMLPDEFSTNEAKELGNRYTLSDRTVDRFLKSACFEKVGHGKYRKTE